MKYFLNKTVRLLNVQLSQIVENNDGKKDGLCGVNGIFGYIQNILFEEIRKRVPNFRCTIDSFDNVGEYNYSTGQYNGAIKDLLDGKYDSLMCPIIYPLNTTDESIVYTKPLSEATMTILSFYNLTNVDDAEEQDITFMFSTVPAMLWLWVFLSYLTFIAVLKLGHWLLDSERRSDSIWTITCAFLNEDNFPENHKYIALLSVVMATGVFFAMNFLGNITTTDLVSVDSPILVKSYQNIIDRGISVFWSPLYAEQNTQMNYYDKDSLHYKVFKNKKQVSPIEKSWQNTLRYFTQQQVGLGNRKLVEAGSYMIMLYTNSRGIPFHEAIPQARGLLSAEDNALKFTYAIVSRLNDGGNFTAIRKLSYRLNGRMTEIGLFENALNNVGVRLIEWLYGEKVMYLLQQKISSKVEETSRDPVSVKMVNIRKSINIYFGMILLAFAAFLIELLISKSTDLVRGRKSVKISPIKLEPKRNEIEVNQESTPKDHSRPATAHLGGARMRNTCSRRKSARIAPIDEARIVQIENVQEPKEEEFETKNVKKVQKQNVKKVIKVVAVVHELEQISNEVKSKKHFEPVSKEALKKSKSFAPEIPITDRGDSE